MVGELLRESIGMKGERKSDVLKGLRILKEVLPPTSVSLPRTIYGGDFFHRSGIKKSEQIQKLIHFADCIHHGILPDGEVMVFMADAITEYLEGNKLTLDSAFALKAKPKKGNAAKHYKEDSELLEMFITMHLYQIDLKITQKEAAIKTLKLYEKDIDVENFQATYRRTVEDKKQFEQMVAGFRNRFPRDSE